MSDRNYLRVARGRLPHEIVSNVCRIMVLQAFPRVQTFKYTVKDYKAWYSSVVFNMFCRNVFNFRVVVWFDAVLSQLSKSNE